MPMVDDYIARINKFNPIELIVLKPDKEDSVAKRMIRSTGEGGLLVALDENGKHYTSVEFSKLVSSWMNRGLSSSIFAIGGADGLPKEVLQQADLTISLSKMTLPHRLARLLLAEQIYRAICIEKNLPYHK